MRSICTKIRGANVFHHSSVWFCCVIFLFCFLVSFNAMSALYYKSCISAASVVWRNRALDHTCFWNEHLFAGLITSAMKNYTHIYMRTSDFHASYEFFHRNLEKRKCIIYFSFNNQSFSNIWKLRFYFSIEIPVDISTGIMNRNPPFKLSHVNCNHLVVRSDNIVYYVMFGWYIVHMNFPSKFITIWFQFSAFDRFVHFRRLCWSFSSIYNYIYYIGMIYICMVWWFCEI